MGTYAKSRWPIWPAAIGPPYWNGKQVLCRWTLKTFGRRAPATRPDNIWVSNYIQSFLTGIIELIQYDICFPNSGVLTSSLRDSKYSAYCQFIAYIYIHLHTTIHRPFISNRNHLVALCRFTVYASNTNADMAWSWAASGTYLWPICCVERRSRYLIKFIHSY